MRGASLLLFLLLPCSNPFSRRDETPAPAQAPLAQPAKAEPEAAPVWYPLEPLLVGLRPSLRSAPPLGNAATELPFYELGVIAEGERFGVRETLWFTQREAEPLPELVLRLYANAGVSGGAAPRIRLLHGNCLDGVRCRVELRSPTSLVVTPSKALAHGARLRVSLELSGTLEIIDSSRTNMLAQGLEGMQRIGMGGGHGGYGLLARGDGIVSLANFYAVLAPRRDGAWASEDNLELGDLGSDDLAHVIANVVTQPGERVVASGVQVASDDVEGHVLQRFVAGYVRDFSVLWSRAFARRQRMVGDVAVSSYHLAGEADAGERVLDAAARSLGLFEQRFGRYPYPELDVVESPLVGGAGGVEFCGLLTVASMFYRPLTPGSGAASGAGAGGLGFDLSSQKPLFDAMLEFVTAHEVAHQYWHGLVGNDSRENPFADEALAQYSALLYIEARYGPERAELEAQRQVAMNYQMMRLMQIADGPVDRPVRAFAGQMEYAGLVYGKGPFVYRELRRALGDEAFFAGVHAYVDRYRFSQAPAHGLIDMLAKGGARARVRALAAHWLEQDHGDEDLGEADLGKLLGGGLGEGAGDLMSLLGPLLKDPNALKSLLGGGTSDDAPGGSPSELPDIDALLQNPALQQLLQNPGAQPLLSDPAPQRGLSGTR